jgi:outer membrane lipoprotein-sorting protein
MRRAFVIVPFLSLGVAHAQPAAPSVGVQDVLAGLRARYAQAGSFEADVTESLLVKAYNRTIQRSGHLALERPGDMELDFPNSGRLVRSGRWIAFHDRASNTVSVQGAPQVDGLTAFFTGMPPPSQQTYRVHAGAAMGFTGGVVLDFSPPPSACRFLYFVDSAAWEVRRIVVVDGQGNRRRFDFASPTVGGAVAPTHFAFPNAATVAPASGATC